MATTASSLIAQVRSLVRDYGDARTTLVAAVTDTTGTSISLSDIADIPNGSFLQIDTELFEVISTVDASPDTATVVRGARGSTAATHTNSTLVRINHIWGDHEVLRALNQALDAAFPSIYTAITDSTTTHIAADTWEYDIPATIGILARVEMETSTASIFEPTTLWSYQDHNTIVIENAAYITAGYHVRMVGYGKFDAMTLTGNLDTDYPDTNANAIEYLVTKAGVNLLRTRQAAIGRRDAFIGMTDSFQQGAPYASAVSAKELEVHAKSLLKQCRMPRLAEYLPDPARLYYGRG